MGRPLRNGDIARPYKPKDKSKAEVGVQVVERWILARLRKRQFFSLAELNEAIRPLLKDLNQRPFQSLPGSRHTLVLALDRPALKALPIAPYEYAKWEKVTVGVDYHVKVEQHYYSVPHILVGKVLETRLTARAVEVLYRRQRVASHVYNSQHGFTTLPAHMPEHHRQQQAWTPEGLRHWANTIGPHTLQFVTRLLHDRPHPEQTYRVCLGLQKQARQYGQNRLEAACERALAIGGYRLQNVASILQQGLDQLPIEATTASIEDNVENDDIPDHVNLRGASYYH